MNRRDAIKIGLVPFLLPSLASPSVNPTTKEDLLVISREIYTKVQDLLDEVEYIEYKDPTVQRYERYDETYTIHWNEWRSLKLKIMWEEILENV